MSLSVDMYSVIGGRIHMSMSVCLYVSVYGSVRVCTCGCV